MRETERKKTSLPQKRDDVQGCKVISKDIHNEFCLYKVGGSLLDMLPSFVVVQTKFLNLDQTNESQEVYRPPSKKRQ